MKFVLYLEDFWNPHCQIEVLGTKCFQGIHWSILDGNASLNLSSAESTPTVIPQQELTKGEPVFPS